MLKRSLVSDFCRYCYAISNKPKGKLKAGQTKFTCRGNCYLWRVRRCQQTWLTCELNPLNLNALMAMQCNAGTSARWGKKTKSATLETFFWLSRTEDTFISLNTDKWTLGSRCGAWVTPCYAGCRWERKAPTSLCELASLADGWHPRDRRTPRRPRHGRIPTQTTPKSARGGQTP